MDECAQAIRLLRPGHGVAFARRQGYTMVTATWKHWPCLFPQHESGKKHLRPIVLATWQECVVQRHAGHFLRGLFHSDGCRITNRVQHRTAGGMKRYEYPRYLFSNESDDILGLCSDALTLLGIEHRRPRRNVISVARRDAVAALDTFVGSKS